MRTAIAVLLAILAPGAALPALASEDDQGALMFDDFGFAVDVNGGYTGAPEVDRHGAVATFELALYRFNTIAPLGTSALHASGTIDNDTGPGGDIALYPVGWSLGTMRSGFVVMAGVGASGVLDRVPGAIEMPVRAELLLPASVRVQGTAVVARSDGERTVLDESLYRLDGRISVALDAEKASRGGPWPSAIFVAAGFSIQAHETTVLATIGWGVTL